MPVAGEKLLHAERTRAVRRPDDDDIPGTARHQLHPSQEERTHQDLAELRVGLHEAKELLAIDLDDVAGLTGAQPDDRRTTLDRAALPGELAGTMDHHQRVAVALRPQHVDFAADHDEERHGGIADLHEHFAMGHRSAATMRRHSRHLSRGQRGEHMLPDGLRRGPHIQGPDGGARLGGAACGRHRTWESIHPWISAITPSLPTSLRRSW